MELSFGQPLGSIVQYAYVVGSIDRAAMDYVDRLGVGPWFVRGPFEPAAVRYRGEPASAVFSHDTIYRASLHWDGAKPLRRSDI